MALFRSPEQASLPVAIEMVDIVSVFYQKLCALVSPVTRGKEQRSPTKLVALIQVVAQL